MDLTPTHYCIVRADLPRGVLAAQLIHAAGHSADLHAGPGPLPAGTRAVALAADDEPHLATIVARARALGVAHVAIHEPDPPWSGALMAVGLAPVRDRSTVRRLTRGLRLLP
ncbi:MAG: peptidyl-tRNA hydrolase [Nannocystaceae bacterium]